MPSRAHKHDSALPTPAPTNVGEPSSIVDNSSSIVDHSTPVNSSLPLNLSAVARSEGATSPEKAPTTPKQDTPRPFGKYELLAEIAHGGMGVVHKARDTALNRVVALKMIRAGYLASEEEIARFNREARAAAQLNHPNIIPVYDVGQHQGNHFFTMKLIQEGNLNQHKKQFFADPRSAVTLVMKIARAVQCAHESGILHRDLKPANVLLDERGEPQIVDFGLAKFLDASVELTLSGQLVGTPAYMAPEQARAQTNQISERTDVWALGVILYELLTENRPFQGPNREEVISQILTATPAPPCALRPNLDRVLETIVLQCLEKEPDRRYPSAEAFAADLERWLEGKRTVVRPPGLPRRLARWLYRHRWAAAGLLLVVASALAGGLLYRPADPNRALKPILEKLAAGEEVTLIPESGPPSWYRWTTGANDAKVSDSPHEAFTVNSWRNLSLLELVPDPQQERYRFEAQIAHLASTREGGVGLYFSQSRYDLPEREEAHVYGALTFSDIEREVPLKAGDPPSPNRVRLLLQCLSKTARDPNGIHKISSGVSTEFTPAGRLINRVEWRDLAVEVTPEVIRAYWPSHVCIGEWQRERLVARHIPVLLQVFPPLAPASPDLSPRTGLGILVYNGSAMFKSVKIKPSTSRE